MALTREKGLGFLAVSGGWRRPLRTKGTVKHC